jgi:hypothetical protein
MMPSAAVVVPRPRREIDSVSVVLVARQKAKVSVVISAFESQNQRKILKNKLRMGVQAKISKNLKTKSASKPETKIASPN